jgi:hypothetical protein
VKKQFFGFTLETVFAYGGWDISLSHLEEIDISPQEANKIYLEAISWADSFIAVG